MTSFSDYLAAVCDLDGVVYRGPAPIPHAVPSLRAWGRPIIYATNNASRTPTEVSAHLRHLGLDVTPEQVVTSAQAAAWILTDLVPAGSTVLAVGGEGVAVALEEAGFRAVRSAVGEGSVAAVVQGYGPQVSAADLAEAAYAVQHGARWLATNTDATLPTDRGVAPGNGSLVAAVGMAVGRVPDRVAGKPHAPCYLLAAERLGMAPREVLAIGDRLDTDIEGAHAAGMDSLLVLTGVDDRAAVADAPPQRRPTYIADDLRVLLHR